MDKKKLLIVDDAEIFITLIKESFSGRYDILSINDASLAVKQIKEIMPDIMLLDVNIPGINGIEIAQILQRDMGTRGIPIIVVTATDYNSLTESILRNEPNVRAFFSKLSPPLTP